MGDQVGRSIVPYKQAAADPGATGGMGQHSAAQNQALNAKTPCHHGSCTPSGICKCFPCWTGTYCDSYENVYPPKFPQGQYRTKTDPSTPSGNGIFKVSAKDDDFEATCKTENKCPCARIKYAIESGNRDALFVINSTTGELFVAPDAVLKPGQDYTLEITARNVDLDAPEGITGISSTTTSLSNAQVTISTIDASETAFGNSFNNVVVHRDGFDPSDKYKQTGYGDVLNEDLLRRDSMEKSWNEPHHREKRAASIPTTPISVSNVTFHLIKTGKYENVTEMRVGSKIHFQLAIHFPSGMTDILVELFTPDNETTIMVVCNPEITHVGENLDVVKSQVVPKMDSKDNTNNYDRAILNFGSVTNSNTKSDHANQSMVFIEWDAVMISNNQTENGTYLWISAGAEFNNETEVWVGQACFRTFLDNWAPTEQPTFNFSGPSQMEIGSSAVFKVDMFIPYPSIVLNFDAFAPLNASDVMSVCSVMVTDMGHNYRCLEKDKLKYQLYDSDTKLTKSRGRLEIGTVTNAGSREDNPTDYNRITVEFTLILGKNESYISQDYWVGAAVEIGTDQIWAGQLRVTGINYTTPNMTGTPTFNMQSADTTVVQGQSIVYTLEMKTPENTDSNYELEVLMPFNESTPQMKLCRLTQVSRGVNIPCGGEAKAKYSSRDNTTITDRGLMNLGRVINIGARAESVDATANTIKFEIVTQMLNHTYNAVGAKAWITAGVRFSDRIWVGQTPVTIGNGTLVSNYTNDTTPTFVMRYVYGSEYMHIGQSAKVYFEMTARPGIIYSPMDLEFITPHENGSSVLSVCHAEVVHVGKNLPCVDKDSINKNAIRYASKSNDKYRYDQAVLKIGSVHNVAESTTNNTNDDKLIVAVVVRMENHVTVSNGTKHWISTGIMYTDTKIWVGQLGVFALKDMDNAMPPINGTPYFEVAAANFTSEHVAVGAATVIHVTIQVPPLSSAAYKFEAVASSKLRICHMRVLKYGRSVPCIDLTTKANYTKFNGLKKDEKGVLDLGIITNVGTEAQVNSSAFGSNSVVLEVIVALDNDNNIAVASTHPVTLTMNYEAQTWSDTFSIITKAPTIMNTTSDTAPTFALAIAPDPQTNETSQDVSKGQVVTFNLDITAKTNSITKMLVKFLTPVNNTGVMEICDVNLMQAGANIPCLKKGGTMATYDNRISSNYTDIATLDLGTVCHFPLETSEDADKIRVEAIAKIVTNSSLTEGEKIWFSGTARINDDQILVGQVALTVHEEFNETTVNKTDANMELNITDPIIKMGPGEVTKVPVVVTTPSRVAAKGIFDIVLPVNETAVMTIRSVRLVSAGRNLACMAKRPDQEFKPTFNSSKGTTQNDKAFLNLGIVTNTGLTQRLDDYKPEDDQFTLEVEWQMADSIINTDNSSHSVSFGCKLGGIILLLDKTVQVTRTNYERPHLDLQVDVNSSITYDASTGILVTCHLKHTNLSTAEGYNVTVFFYVPPYIKFDRIESINFAAPSVSTGSGKYVAFTFERLLFTDVVSFTFLLRVHNATQLRPAGATQANATTPYQAGCNMIWRVNHANVTGSFFNTTMSSMAYIVQGPKSTDCPSRPLGLEDNAIQDCQISGSASPDKSRQPKDARVNGTSYWESAARPGRFGKYLQVHLGNTTRVTKVVLQHPAGQPVGQRVASYKVLASDDGLNWNSQSELVTIGGPYTTHTQDLTQPVEGRYVRLMVMSQGGGIDSPVDVKAEFLGCVTSADMSLQKVCQAMKTWEPTKNPPDFYSRGFVTDANTMYYCDANPYNDNKMECHSSSDGAKWEALDKTVMNVIGYSATYNELYGIAWDKRSFMVSVDQGQTWMSTSYTRVQQAKAQPHYTSAKEIAWVRDTKIKKAADPHSENVIGKWGGNYEGMYYKSGAWKKVSDWTVCCP